MNLGIIIETKEHEKVWNGLRFANSALGLNHNVKIFLMGEAVEIEDIQDAHFNVAEQMRMYADAGGEMLACGTCIRSRHREDTTACPISRMVDCVEMVEWADKTVTF